MKILADVRPVVERHARALHPGMRLKSSLLLAHPDPQLAGDALPPQQPPQGQRAMQASGMEQTPRRCALHQANDSTRTGITFWPSL